MDSDLMLVIGIILAVLVIPSLLNAFTEGRVPRMAAIILLIAGTLIAVAISQSGSGYTFAELPQVFSRVFARIGR